MQPKTRNAKDGLWFYFILTFALTWAAWLTAIAAGLTSMTFPGILLYILGGCVPSTIGVILLYRLAPSVERKDFWKRVGSFRNIQPGWYGLILFGIPGTTVLAILLNSLTGGSQPGYAAVNRILAQPVALIPIILSGIIGGPLAEELGWRGFALDRMVRRWGLLTASLILGLIWWAWHLPLFFFQGTIQNQWGIGTAYFWIFLLTVFPLAVFISWAYDQNKRSILAAILVHFMFNFTLNLVHPISDRIMLFSALFLCLLAIGVVVFARKPGVQPIPQANGLP